MVSNVDNQSDFNQNGQGILKHIDLPILNKETIKCRARALKARSIFNCKVSNYLVNSSAAELSNIDLNKDVKSDFCEGDFEDLLDEVSEFSIPTAEFSMIHRAVYPPSPLVGSSVIVLRQSQLNSAFKQIVSNAYRSSSNGDSAGNENHLRCNLISKDMEDIHTFSFSEKRDYWKFIYGIRKSSKNESIECNGSCYLLNSSTKSGVIVNNLENNKPSNQSRLSLPNFSSMASRRQSASSSAEHSRPITQSRLSLANLGLKMTNTSHIESDNFRISNEILTITKSSSNQGQSIDIALSDLWAIAITDDYSPVAPAVVDIQVFLNEIVATRCGGADNLFIQFNAAEKLKEKLNYKMYNFSNRFYPIYSRSTLCGLVPLNLDDVLETILDTDANLQSWSIKVVNKASEEVVGSENFPANIFIGDGDAPIASESTAFTTETSSKQLSPSGKTRPLSSPLTNGRKSFGIPFGFGNKSPMKSQDSKHSFEGRSSELRTSLALDSDMDVKPYIALKSPQIVNIRIEEQKLGQLLRLELLKASGLLGLNGKPQAAYCTIYLIGSDGKRLTSNKADVRTDSIKSFEPEWNKTINLQDDYDNIDMREVDAALVLIRDSSSGYLKHRHIGQVTIPISCFLSTKAQFCLPLEPSYRMDAHLTETSYIGEIHITTQLISINNEVKPLLPRPKSLSLISDSAACSAKMTIYRCSPLCTWWPMKVLVPVASASIGDLSGKDIVSDLADGFILAGPDRMTIFLNPGYGGALRRCHEENKGFVTVKWDKVIDMELLTDNALFLIFDVVPMPSAGHESELNSLSVEILIGPCPAKKLTEGLLRRKSLSKVFSQFSDLHYGKEANLLGDQEVAISKIATPESKRFKTLSLLKGRSPGSDLSLEYINVDPLQKHVHNTAEVMENLRNIAKALESFQLSSADDNKDGRLWVETYINCLFRHVQLLVVPSYFNSSVNSSMDVSLLPDYSPSALDRCVDRDVFESQICTPLRENGRSEAMINRYEFFIHAAVMQIRDYALFVSQSDWSTESNVSSLSTVTRRIIDQLLLRYINVLRESLNPFIGSRQAFNSINGQERKNSIIKLLLQLNDLFYDDLFPLLRLNQLFANKSDLLLTDRLEDILAWYSSSLLHDTKQWLFKTLEQAHASRENKFDLPWDVEIVGEKTIASHLPETLCFQLNIYVELCTKDFAALSSVESASSAEYSRSEMYQKLINLLLDAIAKSWVLLSDEFGRSLSSRHWDQSEDRSEKEAYLNFLLAVWNDCTRIEHTHIESLKSIPAEKNVKEGLLKTLVKAFAMNSKVAKKAVVRIIFSGVTNLLIDFDQSWFGSPVSSPTSVMRVVFSHIRSWTTGRTCKVLNHDGCLALIIACAEVVVLRYLLMLRDIWIHKSHSILVQEDYNRMKNDLECATIIFMEILQELGDAEEPLPLKILRSVIVLIVENTDTQIFEDSLDWLICKYAPMFSHNAPFMDYLLKQCILSLRLKPDHLTEELVTIKLRAENSHRDQKQDSEDDTSSSDLLWRIFAENKHEEDFVAAHSAHANLLTTPIRSNNNSSSSINQTHTAPRGSVGKAHHIGNDYSTPLAAQVTTPGPPQTHGKRQTAGPAIFSLKPLREKAADLAAKMTETIAPSVTKQRQNEEFAMNVMRAIGLEAPREVDRHGHHAHGASEDHVGNQSDSDEDHGESGETLHKKSSMSGALFFGRKDSNSRLISYGRHDDESSFVTLHIKNVAVRKLHTNSMFGNANPYVAFTLGNQRCKTPVKWNHGECEWTEHFTIRIFFQVASDANNINNNNNNNCEKRESLSSLFFEKVLLVEVFDKERIRRKRLLGCASVKLNGLELRDFDSWYALEGGDSAGAGEIRLNISITA